MCRLVGRVRRPARLVTQPQTAPWRRSQRFIVVRPPQPQAAATRSMHTYTGWTKFPTAVQEVFCRQRCLQFDQWPHVPSPAGPRNASLHIARLEPVDPPIQQACPLLNTSFVFPTPLLKWVARVPAQIPEIQHRTYLTSTNVSTQHGDSIACGRSNAPCSMHGHEETAPLRTSAPSGSALRARCETGRR